MPPTSPPGPDAEWLHFRQRQQQERNVFQSQCQRDLAEFERRIDVAKVRSDYVDLGRMADAGKRAMLAKQQREEEEFWTRRKGGSGGVASQSVRSTPARKETTSAATSGGAKSSSNSMLGGHSKGVQQRPTTARKAPAGSAQPPSATKTVPDKTASKTVPVKAAPAKIISATAKPPPNKNPKKTSRERLVIDLCSDEEEVAAVTSNEEPTIDNFDNAGPAEPPAFAIPTATLQLFGTSSKMHQDISPKAPIKREEGVSTQAASTSTSTQSFASPVLNRGSDPRTQAPVSQMRGAFEFSQTQRENPFLSSSASTPAGLAGNAGSNSTEYQPPLSFGAKGSAKPPMFGFPGPWSMSMQRIQPERNATPHNTATHEQTLHGLPLDLHPGQSSTGLAMDPMERMLNALETQHGIEPEAMQDNFPALQRRDTQMPEHTTGLHDQEVTGFDDNEDMEESNDVRTTTSTPVTPPHQQQMYAQVSASNGALQLPSPAPSIQSPISRHTLSVQNGTRTTQLSSTGTTGRQVKTTTAQVPWSAKFPQSPAQSMGRPANATPRTPTKRKIVHNMSSGEEDLWEPSGDDEEDYDDETRLDRTPSKTQTRPLAKKPRYTDTTSSATTAKLKATMKNGMNGFGFKTPASKTTPKLPTAKPNTPTRPTPRQSGPPTQSKTGMVTPRTPSRRAKTDAMKRTQAYLSEMERSPFPSDAEDYDDNTQDGIAAHGLNNGVRHMSITPAPSQISTTDSNSARAAINENSFRNGIRRWEHSRAHGDRALMKAREGKEMQATDEECGERSE
ncbi:hypothetical protein NX059_011774 [Plenodomus lindquistii]|nr:hypothetical protein NX059_011774 [Plenodomus lindquistii]